MTLRIALYLKKRQQFGNTLAGGEVPFLGVGSEVLAAVNTEPTQRHQEESSRRNEEHGSPVVEVCEVTDVPPECTRGEVAAHVGKAEQFADAGAAYVLYGCPHGAN